MAYLIPDMRVDPSIAENAENWDKWQTDRRDVEGSFVDCPYVYYFAANGVTLQFLCILR